MQDHVGACNQAMKEREIRSLQPHSLSQGTQPCPCPLPESTNATGKGPDVPQPAESPKPAMCIRGKRHCQQLSLLKRSVFSGVCTRCSRLSWDIRIHCGVVSPWHVCYYMPVPICGRHYSSTTALYLCRGSSLGLRILPCTSVPL